MLALSDITPFILTYNEEPNLERCLESVKWASQILVLDSGSADGTAAIVARYPQARLVVRPFDCHSKRDAVGAIARRGLRRHAGTAGGN